MNTQEFILHCFNHPVETTRWFENDFSSYVIKPEEYIDQLIETLRSSQKIIENYDIDQVAQGLDYILGWGSDYFETIRTFAGSVDLEKRRELYKSLKIMYDIIFSPFATNSFYGEEFSLNTMPYIDQVLIMMYDSKVNGPIYFVKEKDVHEEILGVYEHGIGSSNIAVVQSSIWTLGSFIHSKHLDAERIIKSLNEVNDDNWPNNLKDFRTKAINKEIW